VSDDEMLIVKGELRPLTWAVECPLCGGAIEIECVEQDDAGVWYASEGDIAPECPTCKVCVESDGVALKTIAEPSWRGQRG
jgi:hypothetical protein